MKTIGNGDYDTITFRMYANVCQSYTNHISLQKKKPLMRRLIKKETEKKYQQSQISSQYQKLILNH